jgi:hypothetical protein
VLELEGVRLEDFLKLQMAEFILLLGGCAVAVIVLSRISKRAEDWHIERKEKKNKYRRKAKDKRYPNVQQTHNAASLYTISNQIEAHIEQNEYQDEGREFRDWITICALIAAGLAGGLSVWYLRVQIREAREFSNTQHTDTILAINEATRAANEAARLATAAEKNIPRAWLYISFPKTVPALPQTVPGQNAGDFVPCNQGSGEFSFSPFPCIERLDHPNRTRSYRIYVSFSIDNQGKIPATIESAEAHLFTFDPNVFGFNDLPFDKFGRLLRGISVYDAVGLDEMSGITIRSDSSANSPKMAYFLILSQIDTGEHFMFFDKWIDIVIRYRDPYGSDRQSGYMAKVGSAGIRTVADDSYTYQH